MGACGPGVRSQHPRHGGRRGAHERERLWRRARPGPGVGNALHRRGLRAQGAQRAGLPLPGFGSSRRRGRRRRELRPRRGRPRGGQGPNGRDEEEAQGGTALRHQDLRLDLRQPRGPACRGPLGGSAARCRRGSRPPPRRGEAVREARELRREHRRSHHRRRVGGDGLGPQAGSRPFWGGAGARGPDPRRRRVAAGLGAVGMRRDAGRRTQLLRRRIAVGALVVAVLVCGYWFWLRDSSLVAVEEVEVRGATANAEQVNGALERVAREMTTLHVEDEELAKAVAGFPTVASIAADASIPHKLTVTVTERLPVAVVKGEGEPVGVSADGLLLPGLDVSGQGLPEIDAEQPKGGRLGPEGAAQAAIVGGATEDLRRRIEVVGFDEARGGVVIELENGPEARFGGGADAESKWRGGPHGLFCEGGARGPPI